MGHKYGCFTCNKLIVLYLSPDDFPTHLFIPGYQQSSDLLVKSSFLHYQTYNFEFNFPVVRKDRPGSESACVAREYAGRKNLLAQAYISPFQRPLPFVA